MDNNIQTKDNSIRLNINPKIYPLSVVYSAAYVFLDRAYILLDGDPDKEIKVKLEPKNKEDLERLGKDFMNELINYADYQNRAEQTKKVREILLQRSLITNSLETVEDNTESDSVMDEIDDDDFLDDPEEIAIPWEEKYGKKEDDTKAE